MSDERPWRVLASGQRSVVWTAARHGGAAEPLLETDEVLLEAPNWAPDGTALLLNGDGGLWRLPLDGSGLERVPIDGLPPINNDHVLHPDGRTVLLSAVDGALYQAPLAGGSAERLTAEDGLLHFLHGISPDGATLAAVVIARETPDFLAVPGRLMLLPAEGGPGRIVDTGPGHLDGPEYSPDGAWLLCNTEAFTTEPGHAQLARLPAEGGALERLLASPTVDWFPHPSPDGTRATYVAFPPGTLGHPADLPVEVRLVDPADWSAPIARYPVPGGQGTLNVNSWAPDGSRFAFVSYPIG